MQQRRSEALTDQKQLSIVVPVFNEGSSVRRTLEELRTTLPEAEVIVVDDGSNDDTASQIAGVEGLSVASHDRNRGYGAALKSGMRKASRPFVAWFDGDGQHRIEDLIDVAAPVLSSEVDAAIGARGRGSGQQLDRLVGKKLLSFVAESLVGQRIPDLNSGLRCFRRDLIRRYLHLLPDGFSASTTSTLMLIERGYRVRFVPIRTRPREGSSKIRIVADGFSTLQLIFRLVVLFNALRVFTLLGAILILPGLVYGVTIALMFGRGFPILAGTAILAGVLTIFMGVVADQVTELRKERFEDRWD
jgi:glycosyltransferase involved in cell wall biosynthesis